MTRTVLADFVGWPPSLVNLNFQEHQNFVNEVIARIGPMPAVWTGTANQVLVVNDLATGPQPVSVSGATFAKFGNKPVRAFKPYVVPVSASVDLTDDDHGGAIVDMTGGSAKNVTIALDGDPAVGISTPFRCEVRRAHGSGAVTFVFSGVTNRNPNGHTRIQNARGVVVTMIGTQVYLDGYTEA